MAIYRPTPTCPYCGKEIAKSVRRKATPGVTFIGDNFIRWNYTKHSCKGKREADKKMKKAVHEIWDRIKRRGGKLPPFIKQ